MVVSVGACSPTEAIPKYAYAFMLANWGMYVCGGPDRPRKVDVSASMNV